MEQRQTLAKRDTSVITQSQALYLLKTIWKDAPESEVIKAAILCRQYNLNPLMRQVYLVQFGKEWVTILGIKATRQIAQQALIKRGIRYSYQDGPRVMSEKEQIRIRGKVESDKIWAITIIRDSFDNTFPGYGWWPADKTPYGSDKGNDAFNMAFIRSERNALDKLAPGELPDVDTGDESYVVGDFRAALSEGKKQIIADADQDIKDLWGEKPEADAATLGKAAGQDGNKVGFFNLAELAEQMKLAHFPAETALSWIKSKANYRGLDMTGDFTAVLGRMSKGQAEFLLKEIEDRAAMA